MTRCREEEMQRSRALQQDGAVGPWRGQLRPGCLQHDRRHTGDMRNFGFGRDDL